MSVFNENQRQGASGSTKDYQIENSCRFDKGSNAYLKRTPSSAGNSQKWTVSFWAKLGYFGGGASNHQTLFGSGWRDDYLFNLHFDHTTKRLEVAQYQSGPNWQLLMRTKHQFQDSAAWYHFVVAMDTTQSNQVNRTKLYVNGEWITDFETISWAPLYLSQNFQHPFVNNTQPHYFAKWGEFNGSHVYMGYQAEAHFVDGYQRDATDFGEFDSKYGHWKPKKYTGAYGSNGFYLDFKNASSLGNDANGSNNFTSYNLASHDQMLDTPTNNFATLSEVASFSGYATSTLTEASIRASLPDNAEAKATYAVNSGKWYYEVRFHSGTNNKAGIGFRQADNIPYSGGNSLGWNGTTQGMLWFGHSGIQGYAADGSYGTYGGGTIIGVCLDLDNRTVFWTKNGVTHGTKSFSGAGWDYVVPSLGSSNSSQDMSVNFGQDAAFHGMASPGTTYSDGKYGEFFYQPPSGYKAMCSLNLPNSAVVPGKNFNAVTYAGSNSTQSIIGVGFSPELLWVKVRTSVDVHMLYDIVRGSNSLSSDTSGQESNSTQITSYDSDGFTFPGNKGVVNRAGQNYVAWNWKAGGGSSAGSNLSGVNNCTQSVNQAAGFSIVKWTATQAGPISYGHGLSKAPEMIISKSIGDTDYWSVGHDAIGWTKQFQINTNGAAHSTSAPWNNTAPTSTIVYKGGGVNNGQTHINYHFHSVPGYSRMGSYTGNSSVNGPMVYLGFRARYLLVKCVGAAEPWMVLDTARDTYNASLKILSPNSSAAENGPPNSDYKVDFFSNGFKLRANTGAMNSSSQTYIYMAFAEYPFKVTTAR